MTFRCRACGWVGENEDRVPASAEWIAEHDVDSEWFTSHDLNCPDCGEADWLLEGDDDVDVGSPGDDDGAFADTQILLVCPVCDADVPYGEVMEVQGQDGFCQCPDCGDVSPVDDWFQNTLS